MLFLLIVFSLSFFSLTVIVWVGTLFIQEWYYTEPTKGILWQAPVTGAGLAAFYTIWCLLILAPGNVRPDRLPYDTLFRFSPKIDMFDAPAPTIQVFEKRQMKPTEYEYGKIDRHRGIYKNKSNGRPYRPYHVKAIVIKKGKEEFRFEAENGDDSSRQTFRSDKGWAMTVYAKGGPTGLPYYFDFGRFFVNLFLNFVHFVLWFCGLWLVLRFRLGHAIALAFVLWLAITLIVLPMMLINAATWGTT